MCNSGAPFDKESALLLPVQEEFSRRHSEAFPLDEDGVEVNPDDLHPRSAVIMRGLRGLLTGLTDKGCLHFGHARFLLLKILIDVLHYQVYQKRRPMIVLLLYLFKYTKKYYPSFNTFKTITH